MIKTPDNKKYARAATGRFLQEMDRILGSRNGKIEKITATEFSEVVGSTASNLTRLRTSQNNYVTIDMCCKLSEVYGTSLEWLLKGTGYAKNADESNIEKRVRKLEEDMLVLVPKSKTKIKNVKPIKIATANGSARKGRG